jgi:predicted nucleic acid-binding protein
MYVFDATPLIYLGTAGRLTLLAELSAECVTPRRVYEEAVTTGLDAGHADARRVERAVEDGDPRVIGPPEIARLDRLESLQQLSDADAAVLDLAVAEDATAVMDESAGRTVAAVEGIETRGTAFVVLSLLREDAITADTAHETLVEMLDAGWYCSPDLYARIRRRIDDLA